MQMQTIKNKDSMSTRTSKSLQWGLIALLGICLNLVLLSGSIYFGATDTNFYGKEFEKIDAIGNTGLSESDLEKVSKRLSDYVGLKTSLFSEQVMIDGQQVDFFNDKERAHMVDVRGLFVLNVGVGMGALSLIVLALPYKAKYIRKISIWPSVLGVCSLVTIIFVAGLGLLMMIDFSSAFIAFHKLFFTNDLWLLDPATDRMIVLLEEQFFQDIAVYIMIIYSGITLSLGAFGMIFKRLKRPNV